MAIHVRSIEVAGFASIRHAEIELRDLNVLIGANGAGKSNVVRVFELLGRIADDELGLFVGYAGGAASLLNAYGAREISLNLALGSSGYHATLAPATNDELLFADERVFDQDSTFLLGRGHRVSKLRQAIDETVTGSVRFLTGPIIEALVGCRVYHFHDTSRTAPVKRMAPTADNLALRYDGGNLAAVLMKMQNGPPDQRSTYDRIVTAVRQAAPFFDDFELKPEGNDHVRLRWRQRASEVVFSAEQMSDGTLRFACLVTLLLSPDLPDVVVLDEPELGLHPFAIAVLADLLRVAARRSQVVVATQSVTLVNQLDPDDLIVVERLDDGTVLRRPDLDKLSGWLDDFALGELWEKNIIGGRPGRAGGSLA